MVPKIMISLSLIVCTSCVVLPENDYRQNYQCGLSTEMKVLKIVSLTDGDASFYAWNDDILAVLTVPTTAVISGTYVLVNNTYHIGERLIKCG